MRSCISSSTLPRSPRAIAQLLQFRLQVGIDAMSDLRAAVLGQQELERFPPVVEQLEVVQLRRLFLELREPVLDVCERLVNPLALPISWINDECKETQPLNSLSPMETRAAHEPFERLGYVQSQALRWKGR
jgi:hypothetical protein